LWLTLNVGLDIVYSLKTRAANQPHPNNHVTITQHSIIAIESWWTELKRLVPDINSF